MQPLKQLTSLPKTFYVPAYPTVNAIPALSHLLLLQIPIEQNRCAMVCQGCGAVLFLLKKQWNYFP
jgi:hypothetical protein